MISTSSEEASGGDSSIESASDPEPDVRPTAGGDRSDSGITETGRDWVRVPQQARSQETFDRFLKATAELLEEKPFDQVTVSDIVQRAERTVGSFYARFEDKYAVLYEVIRERDEMVRAKVAFYCDGARWVGMSLEEFVAEAVRLNVVAYRRSPRILRTAVHAAAVDERFRNLRKDSLQFCAEQQKNFLFSRSDEVGRADVARASDQMFEIMTTTLEHELLFGQFTKSSPESDADLVKDLTARCLFALGLDRDSIDRQVGT